MSREGVVTTASTQARVVGSGYTVLSYNSQPIAYCEGWLIVRIQVSALSAT